MFITGSQRFSKVLKGSRSGYLRLATVRNGSLEFAEVR